MFFTQDDYKKIQQWLIKNSVKDTEFSEANIPFNGEETITIVQGNQNKKVFLKDLIAQVFNLGISDFVNITDKYDAPNISLEEAIRLIPSRARKEGQVITFLDMEDHWHIYQFKGVLNQWNVLDTWEDLFDWEKLIIDSILPDEEDLTKSEPDANSNSYLSLKDRAYNPEDFSGLGRIILRKNIVEVEDPIYGKVKNNILYQDMFTQSNTIYEIRYDFDLGGKEITIPEGCVLDFQGGSFSNGAVCGNRTIVKSSSTLIFSTIKIKSSWNIKEVYSDWFDFDVNGDIDCSSNIENCINMANCGTFYLSQGNYLIGKTLNINDKNICIVGNGDVILKKGEEVVITIDNSNEGCDVKISNITIDGCHGKKTSISISNSKSVEIKKVKIVNIGSYEDVSGYVADGISIVNCSSLYVANCHIENVKRDGIHAGAIENILIEYNKILKCGRYAVVNDGGYYKQRASLLTNYNYNYIEDCDGGLHAETTSSYKELNPKYVVENNIIKNCGFNRYDYCAAITSGNYLHSNINNNIIENYAADNDVQVCITYSDPLSITTHNNIIDDAPKGIIYYANTITPSFVSIDFNILRRIKKQAILVYLVPSNVVVSNNTIHLSGIDGIGITADLCPGAKINDNTINADYTTESKTVGINITQTVRASVLNNICTNNVVSSLNILSIRNGAPAYNYIRNYHVCGNVFKNNGLFDCDFEVNNSRLLFTSKNYLYVPKDIEGFSYSDGDVCNSASITYEYFRGTWINRTQVAFLPYNEIPKDAPQGTAFFCTDKQNKFGRNGVMLLSTGSYSFRGIDGGFYSIEHEPKFIGTTEERPTSTQNVFQGVQYFDTTLNKPIWWTGSKWVDATGADV